MNSIFKALIIVLLLMVPTAVVSASSTNLRLESALQSNVAVPVKFSQQIVAGTLPEWQRLAPTYAAQSPLPVHGQAMYYNPGVMQKVIAYRQRLHQIDECADCIGYVALLRAGDINRKVWLQVSADTIEGPFLVTDVAARHDIPRLLRIGWGIDVDWETAKRWNLKMPMVTILDTPPAGMIINSTAAWRSSLQAASLMFNEIAPWSSSTPINMQNQATTVNESIIQVRPVDNPIAQPMVPPAGLKGTVVNNIFFKQGPLEIRLEKVN